MSKQSELVDLTQGAEGNISAVNATLTGYLRGPATFTIDPAVHGNNTGLVVIAGNLQVDGTQTTINSTTMDVDDLNITVASGAANAAAANGAGLTVDGASATLLYASAGDNFVFNKSLSIRGFNGPVLKLGSNGTTDPRIDFEDQNSTNLGAGIFLDQDADTLRILRTVSGSATDGIAINASGDIGIGIASPTSKVDIRGPNGATQSRGQLYLTNTDAAAINQGSQISLGGTYSGTGDTYFASVAGRKENATSGNYQGYLQFATRQTSGNIERMRIDSSGNVGIGTAIPSVPLTVNNNTDHSDIAIFHAGGGTPNRGLKISTFSSTNSNAGVELDAQHATGAFKFSTGGTERMRITSTGEIVTGGLTSSTGQLHLYKADATGGKLVLQSQVASDATAKISMMSRLLDNTNKTAYIEAYRGNINFGGESGYGNVGIGTASPTTKLHVSTTGEVYVATIENLGTAGNKHGLWIKSDSTWSSSNLLKVTSGTSDTDTFIVNPDRVYIVPNVGIGTDSPEDKLEVQGALKVKASVNHAEAVYLKFGRQDQGDGNYEHHIKATHGSGSSQNKITFALGNGTATGKNNVLIMDGYANTATFGGPVVATTYTGSGASLTGVHHTYDIEYLIVGGGGGGGTTVYDDCGGGGAGGYRSSITGNPSANYAPPEPPLPAVVGNTYAVSVGAGGGLLGGGNDSGFGLIQSEGGGRAGNHRGPGASGGSGGGGSGKYIASDNVEGGIGYYGQGNNGGQASNYSAAGGGGGAGAVGAGGSGSSFAGGAGVYSLVESAIAGQTGYLVSSRVYRAGGGGSYGGGAGGLGGGGRGWSTSQTPTAGAVNTGSGGGGNKENHANSATVGGGSGIVILKVPTSNYTGTTTGSPTVTTIGNYKILKFTSSGSYTA